MPSLKIVFLAISLFALSTSWASQKIDKEFTVQPQAIVGLDLMRGKVEVKAWDKNVVKVTGHLDDSARQLNVVNKGNKLILSIQLQGKRFKGNSSSLSIMLPKSSPFKFKGVDTDIRVVGVQQGVYGKNMSGNLEIANVTGPVKLSSVSGDITLTEVNGEARIETVSGDLVLSGDLTKVFAKTMSGDIKLAVDKADDIQVKNVSGFTEIIGDIDEESNVFVASVSGDIDYKSKGQLNAECEIKSQFGGKITNLLPVDANIETGVLGKTMRFVSGKGDGKLLLKSLSGQVKVSEEKVN